MEGLKKERKHVKCAITRTQTWFENNVDRENNVHAFIVRLESLNEAFSKYNELQDKIEDLDEDMLEVENRLEIEDKCFSLLAQIRSQIDKLTKNVKSSVVPNQGSVLSPEQHFSQLPPLPNQFESDPIHRQRVKLPDISIPPFTGEISQWTSFMELFSALILNDSSLTNIQKFIYLKSYLLAN